MFSLDNLTDQMPTTASSMFSAKASVATFMKLFRSVASELISAPFRSFIYKALNYLFAPLFSGDLSLVVNELSGMTRNQVFDAAELYLRTKIGPHTERLRISKASWKKNNGDQEGEERQDIRRRYFELTFHKKHMDKVISSYLPYVIVQVDAIKAEEKVLKLYTRHIWLRYDDDDVANSKWRSVNLEHPSTFDTMAMEPEMKKMIVEDLERFVRRKEFYKKVGKAWKMGYLLYGAAGDPKIELDRRHG